MSKGPWKNKADPMVLFWEKTEPGPGGCILWTGAKTPGGYGKLKAFGTFWVASRFIWTQEMGPIPPGYEVCHDCDIRACVNIAHLFLGTRQDNMDDMVRKGRQNTPRGEEVKSSKLNRQAVREMRELYAADMPISQIAERYEVAANTAFYVVKHITWKEV